GDISPLHRRRHGDGDRVLRAARVRGPGSSRSRFRHAAAGRPALAAQHAGRWWRCRRRRRRRHHAGTRWLEPVSGPRRRHRHRDRPPQRVRCPLPQRGHRRPGRPPGAGRRPLRQSRRALPGAL
ncbi:MAG: Glyoxalase/bleomycin resistance protein/dioxygenase, partial [uncultured Acidimicrobiales bacterium]